MRYLIGVGAKVALLLAAIGYGGAYSWVLDYIDAFRLHVVFGAGFLVVAALSLRLWRSALISMAAAVLAAAGLGPALQEPVSTSPATGPEFVLVYANVYDQNATPLEAAEALLTAGADVLVTSETLPAIGAELRNAYPFAVTRDVESDTLRTAIWSRLPLSDGRTHLNNTVAPTAADAIIQIGATGVHLTGVHFARAIEGLRAAETEGLARIAGGMTRPRIIIGDFNAESWSWVVTRSADLTGTQVLGGHRITWSGEYPTPGKRLPSLWGHGIDHMLHSPEILVREVDTLVLPGSDHRALRVRVQLRQG